MVARSWQGGENGESVFNSYRVSDLQDEKVMGIGGGDCYTTM